MKLSDIKGERSLEVVADLMDPIANIALDPDASRLFRREQLPDGMTARDFMVERARTSVHTLFKGHKRDLIKIFATIEGVSSNRYTEELNLAKLLSDFIDLMTDEVFVSLFLSARKRTAAMPSGSASGSTGGLSR